MAKRKKVIERDPKGFVSATYEEEEEDDVLKDGQSIRVPLLLMDGSPNPALDAIQQAVGKDATSKLLVDDGTSNRLNLHRPGFRYSTNPAERVAADAALDQAYAEVEQRDGNAWRHDDHPLLAQPGAITGKKEGDSCSIDGKRGRLQLVGGKLQCVPVNSDAQSVADAYAEYDSDMGNAWRK
jgi:hypothetical protein